MTMRDGIVEQSGRFKKEIASKDTSPYKIVEPGQLVVGFPIDEGVIYVQNFNYAGIMSPAYNVWNIDVSKVLPAYLELALHSPQSMNYYASKLRGTTARRRSMPPETLCQLPIPIPDKDRQGEIVAALQHVKDQRKLVLRQLFLLDALVKSRFVEMFGDVKYSLVMASEIMGSFRNGVSPSKNGGVHSKVLTLSAITQGKFDSSAWKDGAFKEEPPADKRVSDRDFYICRGNGNKELVGTAAFADRDYPDLVFPDTMIAGVIDDARIDRVYLSSAWAQPVVRSQIESKARTTNGTFKINQEIVASVRISLPPLALQQEFAAFVAEVDKSRFVTRRIMEKLGEYNEMAMEHVTCVKGDLL